MESKAEDESASSEPNIDSCHPSNEEENYNIVGSQNAGLQNVPDKRHEEPLSSVSSLEVHFDLLDLTELTDTSDQEHSEVFVELEEEDHNDLSSNRHQMQQAVYMPSPSWTRCSKTQHARELKHCSDSENAETSED